MILLLQKFMNITKISNKNINIKMINTLHKQTKMNKLFNNKSKIFIIINQKIKKLKVRVVLHKICQIMIIPFTIIINKIVYLIRIIKKFYSFKNHKYINKRNFKMIVVTIKKFKYNLINHN